mgnify:CR=1 FL=1
MANPSQEQEQAPKKIRLGDLLVTSGAITQAQLTDALAKQKGSGKKLGEILILTGAITQTHLAEALASQLRLPFFKLNAYHPTPAAIRLLPRQMAERLNVIPLMIDDNGVLTITMADPLDLFAQDEIRMRTGHDIKIGVSTQADIDRNISRLYTLQSNLESAIGQARTTVQELFTPLTLSSINSRTDDAPLIKLVNDLIQQAVREGASDIHIEVFESTARVRFRVDGVLYTAFDYPVNIHPSVVSRIKIISGMDIAEKRRPQDGRILTRIDNRRIDLRVSSLPTMSGEKIVLRILDQDNSFIDLESLGLESEDARKIQTFCETPWGILLVTGPTGSGKSTTLYSMLKKLNTTEVNIITVEDPVEFYLPGVNQVYVNERAGLSFESALRSILRQDPDKLMIGEIRDTVTAQIAIRSALTGHFVLSTLHTNDAPGAITRIVDMGIPPFLVAAALSGVVAQRLVRVLCPFCRQEYEVEQDTCARLGLPHGTRAFHPVGCSECRNGYKGRRGIYEIMVVDDELRDMITRNAEIGELRDAAVRKGMKSLRQAGINAAISGFTSLEEVVSATL